MQTKYFLAIFLLLLLVSVEARRFGGRRIGGRGRTGTGIRRTHGITRSRSRTVSRTLTDNSRRAAVASDLQSKPKPSSDKLGKAPPKATAPEVPPSNPKTVSDKFIKSESSGGSNPYLQPPPAYNPKFNQKEPPASNSQVGNSPGNHINVPLPAGNPQPNYGFNVPPPAYNSHLGNPQSNYGLNVPPPAYNSHLGNPQSNYGFNVPPPAYNSHLGNPQSNYGFNVPPPAYNSHLGNPQPNNGFNVPPPAYNSHAGNPQPNYGFNVPPPAYNSHLGNPQPNNGFNVPPPAYNSHAGNSQPNNGFNVPLPAYNPSGSNYGLNPPSAYSSNGGFRVAPPAYNPQPSGLHSSYMHNAPPAYSPSVESYPSLDGKGEYKKGMLQGALLGGLGGAALGYGGASLMGAGIRRNFDDRSSQEVNINIYANNGTNGEIIAIPVDSVNNGTNGEAVTVIVDGGNNTTNGEAVAAASFSSSSTSLNCVNNSANGTTGETFAALVAGGNNGTNGEAVAALLDCSKNGTDKGMVDSSSVIGKNNGTNEFNLENAPPSQGGVDNSADKEVVAPPSSVISAFNDTDRVAAAISVDSINITAVSISLPTIDPMKSSAVSSNADKYFPFTAADAKNIENVQY